MPDPAPSTEETTTTTGTMTALGAGLEKVTPQTTSETPPSETPPSPKAPEKYADWKVPEGYSLDADVGEAGSKIFKELDLTQDQAQRLVDFYSEHALKTHKDTMDFWENKRAEWREGLKKDSELGKLVGPDGNFGPTSPLLQTVNAALDGLQNPKLVDSFKEAMELTGAGDNPAFVRVLYALAKKVTEGTTYASGGEPSKIDPRTGQLRGRPSPGAAMYPNLPSDADRRASGG